MTNVSGFGNSTSRHRCWISSKSVYVLLAWSVGNISLTTTARYLGLLWIPIDFGYKPSRRERSGKWLNGFVVLWGVEGIIVPGSLEGKWSQRSCRQRLRKVELWSWLLAKMYRHMCRRLVQDARI